MIHVDRSRVAEPKTLRSKRAAESRWLAHRFFSRSRSVHAESSRAQERHSFDERVWFGCWDELDELFHSKCAYCETPVDGKSGSVHHHRPRSHASDLDRKISDPDHYWWLAYEWENLYLICHTCERHKAEIFPVENERAQPRTKGPVLATEGSLLLDPCADDPRKFLGFQSNGAITSRVRVALSRSATTVQALALHRQALVDARGRVAREAATCWNNLRHSVEGTLIENLASMRGVLSDAAPFAAAARAEVRRQLEDDLTEKDPYDALRRFRGFLGNSKVLRDLIQEFRLGYELLPTEGPAVVTRSGPEEADEEKSPDPVSRGGLAFQVEFDADEGLEEAGAEIEFTSLPSATVTEIEIENFRSLRNLHVQLPDSTSEAGAWKVFLGENGTGKSSVLKALAIALLGKAATNDLERLPAPEQLLQRRIDRNGRAYRVRRSRIRVGLSTGHEIVVEIDKKGIRFESGEGGVDIVLRGFGANRLLPEPTADALSAEKRQVCNLFDPRFEFVDPDRWIRQLIAEHGEAAFSPVALALKDLLNLESDEQIQLEDDGLWVEAGDARVRLSELSDGYQSVIALGIDIISGLRHTVPDFSVADFSMSDGIVLLDELGAHLHPRWRMKIVRSLRMAFARMQFLCTTHEPLCLCGLKDGEIAVLRRRSDDRRVEVLDEGLPSAEGLRADQLLTSPLFGLHSTIDPEIEHKFQEYYALLAHHETELKPEQVDRKGVLKRELGRYGVLGYTRRDQMIYELIDQFLAEEAREAGGERRQKLKEATREKVREIWKRLDWTGQ